MNLENLSDDTLRSMLAIGSMPFAEITSIREELVRRYWAVQAPAGDWCETCGTDVVNEKCHCWVHLAHALEQYLGYDHDTAANQAAILWDELFFADKLGVWTAKYADDHDVQTYPKPVPRLFFAD
jgi:hypothetical protein